MNNKEKSVNNGSIVLLFFCLACLLNLAWAWNWPALPDFAKESGWRIVIVLLIFVESWFLAETNFWAGVVGSTIVVSYTTMASQWHHIHLESIWLLELFFETIAGAVYLPVTIPLAAIVLFIRRRGRVQPLAAEEGSGEPPLWRDWRTQIRNAAIVLLLNALIYASNPIGVAYKWTRIHDDIGMLSAAILSSFIFLQALCLTGRHFWKWTVLSSLAMTVAGLNARTPEMTLSLDGLKNDFINGCFFMVFTIPAAAIVHLAKKKFTAKTTTAETWMFGSAVIWLACLFVFLFAI